MASNALFRQPDEASTPLSAEEQSDLIPSYIAFRHELNAAEQQNIARAQQWAFARKRADLLSESFVLELHRRMLNRVWKWAGKYRQSERNSGVEWWRIQIELRNLLADAKAWVEFRTYSQDEIAVRFHHRLVAIHPFPNGNGRHARLMADLLIVRLGGARFTWGRTGLQHTSEARQRYVLALRTADVRDLNPLITFARA